MSLTLTYQFLRVYKDKIILIILNNKELIINNLKYINDDNW